MRSKPKEETLQIAEEWRETVVNGRSILVSNKGRVAKVSTAKPGASGYTQVSVASNGDFKCEYVHRLVALCFLDDFDESLTVNHKDFDRSNNAVQNLEMATHKDQMRHKLENGRGIKLKRLNENKEQIRHLYRLGELSTRELSDKFGFKLYQIQRIIRDIKCDSRKINKISKAEIIEIITLKRKGVKTENISAEYGISCSSIQTYWRNWKKDYEICAYTQGIEKRRKSSNTSK